MKREERAEAERAQYIRRLVAQAPPLDDETKNALALLLRPAVLALRRRRAQQVAIPG